MVEFDDKDIQRAFNECHFRQEYDGFDICQYQCAPCAKVIEDGKCDMLIDYFRKKKAVMGNESKN